MRLVIAAAMAGSVLAIGTVAAQEQGQADRLAFPAGSKFAFVDIQQIAAESSDGQLASVKVQEFSQQKLEEIESKNKELQGQISVKNQELQEAQTQLQQGTDCDERRGSAQLAEGDFQAAGRRPAADTGLAG